ncbi:MAG TPA: hypothetical protein VF759_09055 [Allosphingosinicella sp.]
MTVGPSLSDRFLECVQLGDVDNALARALCYWPEYCSLLKIIFARPQVKQKVLGWLSDFDLDDCVSTAESALVPVGSDNEHGYVRWRNVLLLLLAPACEPANEADAGVEVFRKAQNRLSDLYEERSKHDPARFGFYYRFAAAFQAWVAQRYISEFPHWGATAAVCQDCRGPGKVEDKVRAIVELLYDDVQKTRSTFRAVFGICAKDIGLVVECDGKEKAIERAAQVTLNSPRLQVQASWQPFAETALKADRRLWGELIWIMWEVDDLAFVRRNIAEHERTVHEYVTPKLNDVEEAKTENAREHEAIQAEKREAAWNRLFDKFIYPYLRPFQFTLFVRSATSDGANANADVKFETHRNLVSQHIELPQRAPSDEYWRTESEAISAIERLNDIVGALYEKGFPRAFFRRLQEVRLSSATPERTFPFILFPDGEISFYYALDIARRKAQRMANLAMCNVSAVSGTTDTINAILSRETAGPAREAIWQKGEFPYGLLPEERAFPRHHRCAALVSAANMVIEDTHDAWVEEKKTARVLVETFCKQSGPSDYLKTVLDDPEFCFGGQTAPEVRVEWEPEVMVRRDDPQCHTLFFLPIGRDVDNVPTAMIAGTLHGVEMRWMPFSSKRMVSYLMPLAYILRPLLDRMVHGVFVEQALHAARAEKDRQLRGKLEEAIEGLFSQIDQVARSASRIQAEVTPAPIRFFSAQARVLDKLFLQDEVTEVHQSVLDRLDLDPKDAPRLVPRAPDRQGEIVYEYKATHNMIGKIARELDSGEEVGVAKGLVAATASAMESDWLQESFFKPLISEVRTAEDANVTFGMLKRFLHRYHSLEERDLPIGDILVVMRLCALDVHRRHEAVINLTFNGTPLLPNDEWLKTWHLPAGQQVSFERKRERNAQKEEGMTPPTSAKFLSALSRLLTEEMRPVARHGNEDASITEVNLGTRSDQSALLITMKGDRHLRDPSRLTLDSSETKERGLRSVFTTFAAAVGRSPAFFETRNVGLLEQVTDAFAICHETEQRAGVAKEFQNIRIRLQLPLTTQAGGTGA